MAVMIGVDPHKTPYGHKCQGDVDNFFPLIFAPSLN